MLRIAFIWLLCLGAVLFVPFLVGLIRMSTGPPDQRRRRFWKPFLLGLLIELGLAVVASIVVISICTNG